MWEKIFGRSWFCKHQYMLASKVNLYIPGKIIPIGKEYHLLCTRCGNFKRKRV